MAGALAVSAGSVVAGAEQSRKASSQEAGALDAQQKASQAQQNALDAQKKRQAFLAENDRQFKTEGQQAGQELQEGDFRTRRKIFGN